MSGPQVQVKDQNGIIVADYAPIGGIFVEASMVAVRPDGVRIPLAAGTQITPGTAPDNTAALAEQLTRIEDALLAATGWLPTERSGLYLDTRGDERLSPGSTWPRSTALDFARERTEREPK